MTGRLIQLLRLALADLRGEWPVALAQVIAIAAVLTPLLVLFGLHQGAIGTLIARLDRDPAMRLITPEATGANRFDAAWFARMAGRPDVAFVIPSTRSIAGQIDLLPAMPQPGASRVEVRTTLVPTAPGDPVTGAAAAAVAPPSGTPSGAAPGVVALSARAAGRLGVTAGDTVTAFVERVRGGRVEPLAVPLTVAAVLAPQNDGGTTAYGSLALVEAVQDFRDGKAVPALGVTAGEPAQAAADYPLFRLYARSIRGVQPVAAALEAEGVTVATRRADIASALSLDDSLRAVLLIISSLSVAGYVVAVTAGQWGNLRRKRRDLAILNLTGYGTGWMVAFPVAQAALLAAAGGVAAVAGFTAAAAAINTLFHASIAHGEAACRLDGASLLTAAAVTVILSMAPAAAVGLAFRRIDVNEELRHA